MKPTSRLCLLGCGAALALTVAGCTSSGGDGSPAAVATVTTTAPATATGAPVTGTPTATATGGSTGSAGAGAGGSGGSSGNGAGPGLCTPTVMTFAVSSLNGAAGTQYFSVTATNGSQQPCVTTGYPGVAFLNGSGAQFLQAQRDTSVAKSTLVVEPGQSVRATVAAGDVSGGAGQACTAGPAILFTLPDNTDSTTLTINDASVCDARVQPLVAGAS